MPGASLMPGGSVHVHSAILSGIAGYVDGAGFASLVGLFPAHVTGELVGDAIVFSSGHARDHATHIWMLPVFVSAVVAAAFVARLLRRIGRRPLAGLLALVTVALALFSMSDPLAHVLHESGRLALLVSGGCAVAAMGFQNALMRESLITSCPTTVMTGNLTLVVIDLADRAFNKLLRPSPHDRRPRSRLAPVAIALVAFVSCAALGGFLTRTWGSASVVLPTLVTGFLTAWAWREDRARAGSSTPAAKFGSARMPSFDPAPVWPSSRMPQTPASQTLAPQSPASQSLAPQSSLDPVSVTQLRTGQVLPPPAAAAPGEPHRVGPEKRTISGTQLAQRFRDDQ